MAKDWNADLVARLKGLKSMNEQQQLIVLLFGKRNRTREEDKELELLLKAERAKERAKTAELAATKLLGSRKDAERKARNHRLIQLGMLVDMAGLDGRSRGEILGCLCAQAAIQEDKWVEWKRYGDAILNEKKAANA
jgi:hypothetical protein